MTEPPRPYGEGLPPEHEPRPTSPPPPPAPFTTPGEAPYAPPPAESYPPPTSGGGYTSPPSGGGGYAPPPTSGGGYGQPGTYGQPGAYGQPGGYPPAGGQYGAPGQPGYGAYGGAPAGFASNDDKTWALVAHFGGAAGMFIGGGLLGWVAPMIAMLAKGQSPSVRQHAVAALNFQLLWSIIGLVCYILICAVIGGFLVPVVMIIGIVFGIIAGVKANEGQLYKYPMSVNMIK